MLKKIATKIYWMSEFIWTSYGPDYAIENSRNEHGDDHDELNY